MVNKAMTSFRSGLVLLLRGVMLLVVVGSLVACGNDEEVATDRVEVPDLSPMASDELPDDIESATLEIVDGEFAVEELILTQGEPTDLQVINLDDEAYLFRVEDLVADQEIPADSTTEIGFTTPDSDTYTGQLLDADGDSVLSEVTVTVQDAGGLQ